jgi:hypothetical protein
MTKLILIVAMLATTSAHAYDLAQVKQLVGDQLKDPWSAHYRNVHQSGPVICGEVNAKGGSGGYSGWLPFIIRSKKAMVVGESQENSDGPLGDVYRQLADAIRECVATGVYKAPDLK